MAIPVALALSPRTRVFGASALCLALSMGLSRPAPAAPLPDAEVLFQQGLHLIKSGNAAAACPKFEESRRLDPAPGTQFYLAMCYEATGRTASAWYLFVDVADRSSAEGRGSQEKKARARAAALEPRLCRLSIVVPPALASLPGLQVERDGAVLGPAVWATAIPIDPGEHTVRVTAPRKKGSEKSVTVAGPGTTTTLELEPLENVIDAPAEAPPVSSTPSVQVTQDDRDAGAGSASTQRVVAGVIGGLGIAGIGVGAVFGVIALNKNREWETQTKDSCDSSLRCDAQTLADIKTLEGDRDRAGTISTFGLIGGAVAVVGSVVLWATARPSEGRPGVSLQLAPWLGESSGVVLHGTF